MINAVKAAGFNTIRIPCSWATNADRRTFAIKPEYMALVKQTVDWSRAAGLTVIINSHWDGGWFDESGFRRYSSSVNNKLITLWTQVANTFKNYDSGLLFAVTNEPDIDTQPETVVLMQYYQNWVNMIRATGGNNATRWLVYPGPGPSIDRTYDWFTPPNDPTPGRTVVEVHYYDPYNFCFMNQDEWWGNMAYFWGQAYHTSDPNMLIRNSTWGEEAYMLGQFQKMQAKFTSQGIPVMVGEFGAMKRSAYPDLTGIELQRHVASRTFYNKSVVDYCNQNGLKPIYWDNGSNDNEGWAVFDRNTGAIVDSPLKSALTGGAALPPPN
jgi:aryl-phospho-beta-D-glucosidase BglC (GH1 family)